MLKPFTIKRLVTRITYCAIIPILRDVTLRVGYGRPTAFLSWKRATLRIIDTDLDLLFALLQASTGGHPGKNKTVFHKGILRDFFPQFRYSLGAIKTQLNPLVKSDDVTNRNWSRVPYIVL